MTDTAKKCLRADCNEPRHKKYDWCSEHTREHLDNRILERQRRRGVSNPTFKRTNNLFAPMTFEAGQTVRFKAIDWVSETVIEFEAVPTGNVTAIPERPDGQVTRFGDVWSSEAGCYMVLLLRPEVRR